MKYLEKKKYRVLQKGYRFLKGEIDIIAYDRTTLVFFEVKTRRGGPSRSPEEAVTAEKQQQLRRIASGYIAHHKLYDVNCRFDVLSLIMDASGGFTVRHFRDAF